jgi:purine-nucleoside phosphorylase
MNPRPTLEQMHECAALVAGRLGGFAPCIGVILGTGLGGLARELETLVELPYAELPHFPEATVESHHGRLLAGRLSGAPVLVMQGRFHYYEGWSMQQITFPVRVMRLLGVETLLVSNACGCLNPLFRRGDLMLMEDHLNLLGDNPLIGPNLDEFGPRFPDMSEPYDRNLQALAEELALELRIPLRKGVYAAVAGPNLETRAEYRYLRAIGADVVGMSTVPECIVARQMGMRVAGFSIVTDECFPDALEPAKLEDILAAAARTEPQLTRLVTALAGRIAAGA